MAQLIVRGEDAGLLGRHHPADVEHDPPVGDRKSAGRVLLDEQHREPAFAPAARR